VIHCISHIVPGKNKKLENISTKKANIFLTGGSSYPPTHTRLSSPSYHARLLFLLFPIHNSLIHLRRPLQRPQPSPAPFPPTNLDTPLTPSSRCRCLILPPLRRCSTPMLQIAIAYAMNRNSMRTTLTRLGSTFVMIGQGLSRCPILC